MQHSPRLFDTHGRFLRLPEATETVLAKNDAAKFATYVVLRDAALASEVAEGNVKRLDQELLTARKTFQNAVSERNKAFPKATQVDLAKQYAADSFRRRLILSGAVRLADGGAGKPAPSHAGAGTLLAELEAAIKVADQHVAEVLAELQGARLEVKAHRKAVAAAWLDHQREWPALTPEQNHKIHERSERLQRFRERAGRTELGDSFETLQFVVKQHRNGGNRRGSVDIVTLQHMKANAIRRKLESER